jgi:hypothetical protein
MDIIVPENSENLIQQPLSTTDKLTLELLMNKTHYKKYIEKNEPIRFIEQQAKITELTMYKSDIISITNMLIDEPNTQTNYEINELFNEYTKALIQYIKHKNNETNENHHSTYNDYDDDDDVLFGNMETKSFIQKNISTSFWGKNINFK